MSSRINGFIGIVCIGFCGAGCADEEIPEPIAPVQSQGDGELEVRISDPIGEILTATPLEAPSEETPTYAADLSAAKQCMLTCNTMGWMAWHSCDTLLGLERRACNDLAATTIEVCRDARCMAVPAPTRVDENCDTSCQWVAGFAAGACRAFGSDVLDCSESFSITRAACAQTVCTPDPLPATPVVRPPNCADACEEMITVAYDSCLHDIEADDCRSRAERALDFCLGGCP